MGIDEPGEEVRGLRILLADDHEAYRVRLREFFGLESNHLVVSEAGDGQAAVRLAGELLPDVVIIDVSMPRLNGIDSTRLIKESFPAIHVLALSLHNETRFVEGMLRAGASGYVLKEHAFQELIGALLIVIAGGRYLSAEIR